MPENQNFDPSLQQQTINARRDYQAELLNKDSFLLDSSQGIYAAEEIGISSTLDDGSKFDVVGEFSVDGGEGVHDKLQAALCKVTDLSGNVRFFAAGLEQTDEATKANNRFVELRQGEDYIFGRSKNNVGTAIDGQDLWGRDLDSRTSRKHLAITVGANSFELTDDSMHGTNITGRKMEQQPDIQLEYDASHTYKAVRRMESGGMVEVVGDTKYLVDDRGKRREIIDRNTTRFEGKVDVRSKMGGELDPNNPTGEVIVVDSNSGTPESNQAYENLRSNLMVSIAQESQRLGYDPSEEDYVKLIQRTVSNAMKYDLKFAEEMSEFATRNDPRHQKINLGVHLSEGKGVCRHMALACAWLGEQLNDAGLLQGRFTTKANQSIRGNGAHEWARYTPKSGEPMILDVAQDFAGTLSEAYQKGAEGKYVWGYFDDAAEQGKYKRLVESRRKLQAIHGVHPQHVAEDVPKPKESSTDSLIKVVDLINTGVKTPEQRVQLKNTVIQAMTNSFGEINGILNQPMGIVYASEVAGIADNWARSLKSSFHIEVVRPENFPQNNIPTSDTAREWMFSVMSQAIGHMNLYIDNGHGEAAGQVMHAMMLDMSQSLYRQSKAKQQQGVRSGSYDPRSDIAWQAA